MGVVVRATSCSAVALLTACTDTTASSAVWCGPDSAPSMHRTLSRLLPIVQGTHQWQWVHALSVSKAQVEEVQKQAMRDALRRAVLVYDAQEAASHLFDLPILLKLHGEVLMTLVLQPLDPVRRETSACHVSRTEKHSQRAHMLVLVSSRRLQGHCLTCGCAYV